MTFCSQLKKVYATAIRKNIIEVDFTTYKFWGMNYVVKS